MGEQRCTCCELPIYSCGKVKQEQQRRDEQRGRAALLARPSWFAAHYRGSCVSCGEWFEPGTPITAGSGGWRAECCARPEERRD